MARLGAPTGPTGINDAPRSPARTLARGCPKPPLFMELSRSDGGIGATLSALFAWSSWAIFARIFRDESAATVTSSLVLIVCLTVLARKGMLGRNVAVGAEGIVVRGVGYERTVPYASVRSVDYGHRGVVVRLHDGTEIKLSTLSIAFPTQPERDRRDAVMDRMRGELFAFRAAPSLPPGASSLARGGQSPEAWRRACVGAVTEAPQGYRRASLTCEQAVEILENPAAPVEIRVGAALALSPKSDRDVRRRARDAVVACVDPRLSKALGRALDARPPFDVS